jgi:acetyl esterase
MMALHPLLAEMVAKAAQYPPMHMVPIPLLRAAVPKQLATRIPPEPVASVEDIVIPGPSQPIRVRVYRPDTSSAHPLTVFFHGSGFVICSIETHDAMCRQICNGSASVVVSVDYRLAPENPFPAGPQDCRAAALWAIANARLLGADPHRVALCGDSAGACMAAVVSRMIRDEAGPSIAAQILIYPVTDHYTAHHPSYEERGDGYGLTKHDMRWFWDQYCPDPALGGDTSVSPLRADDLSALPRAYVITAEYDVLRDEGGLYATALAHAGVPVVHRRYADMNHGFLNWVDGVDRATEAMQDLTTWMRNAI